MNKKLIIYTGLMVILNSTPLTVSAVTAPATSSAKVSTKSAQLDLDGASKALINKLASKVEGTSKKNKAISGTVTDLSTSLLKIKTPDDADYTINLDDTLTKYYQITTSAKEITLKNIKKGDYIIASGPIIDKSVTANVVFVDEEYIVKSGKIIEVNKDDSYLKVISSDKDNYTLDQEVRTKMQMVNAQTLEIENTTLGKIKEGDTIHWVCKKSSASKEPNRYSAERILVVPQELFMK